MKRTPEEERIFRALAQIKTPEADLSAALRRAEEPRRIRPVRPLAAAAVLCALLTIGAAAVGFSGAWRYFVHSLPQNAVQTVGASPTQEAAPAWLIPRSRPRRPAGRPLRPPAPRRRGRTRA